MEKYKYFKAIDFASDGDFYRWVKYGKNDAFRNERWTYFVLQHPEIRDEIEEAKILVKTVLNDQQYRITEEKKKDIWAHINRGLPDKKPVDRRSYQKRTFIYSMAAVLVLVVVFISLYSMQSFTKDEKDIATISTRPQAIHEVIRINDHEGSIDTVLLPDGSTVLLYPGSKLRYPVIFESNKREISLSGEAFFDVAKNHSKPFFVFTNEIVTQVLGTSFSIRAYNKEPNISVKVKTGKVSVYSRPKRGTRRTPATYYSTKERELLTPNQQLIFSREKAIMKKSLIRNPKMLSTAPLVDFHYYDTPIRIVFNQLEKTYGVNIVYDKKFLDSCHLNASLDDLTFHEKLRLICMAINAQYKESETHIIITGKGCK